MLCVSVFWCVFFFNCMLHVCVYMINDAGCALQTVAGSVPGQPASLLPPMPPGINLLQTN